MAHLFTGRQRSRGWCGKKKVTADPFIRYRGAITRGDTAQKKLALVFTGDEYGEGAAFIAKALKQHKTKASFFFTGRFYRAQLFQNPLLQLQKDGHYLGAHSNEHLLYNDWTVRDSLLVTKEQFTTDLLLNYAELKKMGITQKEAPFFLPPYEWYNDSIAAWTNSLSLQLINLTPGTLSHADYTTPGVKNYRDSKTIYQSIIDYEKKPNGLNGFILLMHVGTHPERTDKFYYQLPQLLQWLKKEGYQLVRVDDLLKNKKQH